MLFFNSKLVVFILGIDTGYVLQDATPVLKIEKTDSCL